MTGWTKHDETTPPPAGMWIDDEQVPRNCRGVWAWRRLGGKLWLLIGHVPSKRPGGSARTWCYLGDDWLKVAEAVASTTEHGDPIGVWLPVTEDRTGPVVPPGHVWAVATSDGPVEHWDPEPEPRPSPRWAEFVTYVFVGPKFDPPPPPLPEMTSAEAADLLERSIALDDAYEAEGARRNEALRLAVRALRGGS